MTRVSILTPAYKPDFLADALRSALAQTHADFEHVICDDSPGDEVAAIVRDVAGDDPRVRYVRNPGTLGGRANYLQCFDLARGEHIKFLNDDDLLAPDCLARMSAALDAYPAVTLVTSYRRLIDADGPAAAGRGLQPAAGAARQPARRPRPARPDAAPADQRRRRADDGHVPPGRPGGQPAAHPELRRPRGAAQRRHLHVDQPARARRRGVLRRASEQLPLPRSAGAARPGLRGLGHGGVVHAGRRRDGGGGLRSAAAAARWRRGRSTRCSRSCRSGSTASSRGPACWRCAGEFEAAELDLREILASDPDHADAWSDLGCVLWQVGERGARPGELAGRPAPRTRTTLDAPANLASAHGAELQAVARHAGGAPAISRRARSARSAAGRSRYAGLSWRSKGSSSASSSRRDRGSVDARGSRSSAISGRRRPRPARLSVLSRPSRHFRGVGDHHRLARFSHADGPACRGDRGGRRGGSRASRAGSERPRKRHRRSSSSSGTTTRSS